MMLWYGGAWPWWGAVLGWAGMLGFWAVVVWAVYFMVSNLSRRPVPEPLVPDAGRILDERLARGEIDAEQYRAMRELIFSGGSAAPPGWTR